MIERQAHDERAGTFWAWVPAGLLGSMLLGLGSLAYIAADDPGFALEPNYYDKAVHWDRAQAQARASQALGYRLELTQPLRVAADGRIELTLSLIDRQGRAVTGAEVSAEAFANASASRTQLVVLREISPGTYRAELRQGSTGLWELRCAVTRGVERYQQILRRDVAKGPSA
jgi:nitrogen fixation protein FixH